MNANADALPRRHRITAEEYHRMGKAGIFSEDDRVELIEGEIIDMTPIGSGHANTVDELVRLIAPRLLEDKRLRVQNPIALDNNNEPQPDIAVVKNRSYRDAHPGPEDILLLIEVADTSLTYDRTVKIPLYGRHGIAEVWLMDLPGKVVEIFRQPSPDGYLDVHRPGPSQRLQALLVPEAEVDLGELFGT